MSSNKYSFIFIQPNSKLFIRTQSLSLPYLRWHTEYINYTCVEFNVIVNINLLHSILATTAVTNNYSFF